MNSAFRNFATYLENTYGSQFDREEGFVICPMCGEPIYDCDWTEDEYSDLDDNYVCPVCGDILD